MGARVERQGAAAVVVLDWPETRNAVGPDEVVELGEAILAAGAEEGAAAVVITGGEKSFSAGGDLKKISAFTAPLDAAQITEMVYGRFHSMVRALETVPIPTIAAVDGPAIGLGMDVLLASDIRLVGTNGYLAQGWANAGLITGTGGLAFLEHLHPGLTWQLLSKPEKLGAARAAELGVAEAVDGSAFEEALARAEALTALPDAARRAYVQLERPRRWPSPEFLERCAALQGGLLASDDFLAFVKKVLG